MRILGVEFGSWSLKAVEMESRFRRVDVLDFHEVRLPLQTLDPTATYRQAFEQLLSRLPSHPEKVVTALPPAQTALRFLSIPIKQRKKVEQTFRFELEDNVPFKLEEAIVEHYVTRSGDGSLVFAAIAPKKHIQTHLEWLKSIGMDPDWLTFEGMGIVNIYLSIRASQEESRPQGPIVLLDIGHLKTNMAILNEDRLELFRSISWGGLSISQALALTMGGSLEEAERYKINDLKLDTELDGASEEVREMTFSAHQAFTPLIADLNQSLVAYRNLYKKEVTGIFLTGGTAKSWGLTAFLGRSFNVPIELFQPFGDLKLKEDLREADEMRFAEPLGRAMVFARKATLLFNFRQQELGKGTSLTEVSAVLKDPNTLKAIKFAGILAAILFIHVNIASYLADREAHENNELLRKAFSQTFPSVPSKLRNSLTSKPQDLKKFIDQKNKELDQKLKMLSKGRVPMTSLVHAVSQAFPADVKVDVNVLQFDDRTFLMEGVDYEGDLNRVTTALKGIKSLNNVSLTRDGKRFTYRGEVVGR